MKSFTDMVRKSMATKSMGKRMIWITGLQVVRDFFGNQELEWFIKFGTLQIKTQNHEIKIQAFRKKAEILKLVNDKLTDMWYDRKITDIRF
jgi:hypothetical protein